MISYKRVYKNMKHIKGTDPQWLMVDGGLVGGSRWRAGEIISLHNVRKMRILPSCWSIFSTFWQEYAHSKGQ